MPIAEALDRALDRHVARLQHLEGLRRQELAKPVLQHDPRLLRFLYRELCVYRCVVAELTAIREGAGPPS